MTTTQANKLKQKQKQARERMEIRVLSGLNTISRDWLLRKLAKQLQETGVLPVHVQMYRGQIEETEVPEPTRLQPQVVAPSETERAELEKKWENT